MSSSIDYGNLMHHAMRGLIQQVLSDVAKSGLPGEHHFFITFSTDHPGVKLSSRMRERYPDEMTIVIQHSFWDLNVSETFFEIDLSFDDILERLRVPFASLKGFFDPHVKFGVQFDAEFLEAANGDLELVQDEGEDNNQNLPTIASKRDLAKAENKKEKDEKDSAETDDDKTAESADVVSLDNFRKNR